MNSYRVAKVEDIAPELLRDLQPRGKEWVVIRNSGLGDRVWNFSPNERAAKAAVRRYKSRDIVTR